LFAGRIEFALRVFSVCVTWTPLRLSSSVVLNWMFVADVASRSNLR